MRNVGMFTLAIGTALATASVAMAQNAQQPATPQLQQSAPAASDNTTTKLPNTGESLSERLDKSGGVIKPPAGIDPEIKAPPKNPNAGSSMPVIRPPANPEVKPK